MSARNAGSFALSEQQTGLFVAPDADDQPCVWIETDDPDKPVALLRPIDIEQEGRDVLWRHITAGLPRRFTDTAPPDDRYRGLRGHNNARRLP